MLPGGELALGAHNVGVSSRQTVGGEIVHADGFGGLLAGGRFYFPLVGAFRPHVGLALGPLTELPPREVLERKLHDAIRAARERLALPDRKSSGS